MLIATGVSLLPSPLNRDPGNALTHLHLLVYLYVDAVYKHHEFSPVPPILIQHSRTYSSLLPF